MSQEFDHLTQALRNLGGVEHVVGELQRVLRSVTDYDARTGSDLVGTLKTYVESGGNLASTADALFLHRNSVSYRLQRIQDMSGIDPRDPRTRRVLMVAFAVTEHAPPTQDAAHPLP